jgi:hypothetical protein
LKSTSFGLPGARKYPMPDRAHAANAKARATQMVKRGKLSSASAAKIKAKANRVLGKKSNTGVNADLNAATLGPRAIPRAGGGDNRNPATPYQEDINSWKSKPVTERGKWMNNSTGGKGAAADDAQVKSKKGQAKFGGTEAPVASKKGQSKYSGGTQFAAGTEETGINYKKQEKHRGTGTPTTVGSGKRYANGSSSHDNMRTVIRDH